VTGAGRLERRNSGAGVPSRQRITPQATAAMTSSACRRKEGPRDTMQNCARAYAERFLELGFIVGAYTAAGQAGASAFDEPLHGADGDLFG
jgi:hypothetical protein